MDTSRLYPILENLAELTCGIHAPPKFPDATPEEVEILRAVARGDVAEATLGQRIEAVLALPSREESHPANESLWVALLNQGEPELQLYALHRLAKGDHEPTLAEARRLVVEPETSPVVALAAAELAAHAGDPEIGAELRALRERWLQMGAEEDSPSLRALDEMMAEISG